MTVKAFATLNLHISDVASSGFVLEERCVFGASRPMNDSTCVRPRRIASGLVIAGVSVLALFIAGCAQSPSSGGGGGRSSEYFPASKYGPASPRVVTQGQTVPRGGGRRLVGRPYTIAGKRYVPREVRPGFTVTGIASWYGAAFHGRRTANGEVYDMRGLSAAHPTMPLPSYARVTNLRNGHSIVVRVNDRGPFHARRVLDVSQRVAETLDFRRTGTGRVKVDYIGPAGLAGSDDRILMASLRTDGRPATIPGPTTAPTTMIAQQAPEATPQAVAVAAEPRDDVRSGGTTVVSASRALPPSDALTHVAPAGLVASGAVPAFAPFPPPRPLDLATIPGADTPIAAFRRRAAQPTFFAEPSPVASTLMRRGPFDGVNLDGLQPLR